MNKLLSVEEVADLLGLKQATIYKYRLQGAIPYIKLGTRVLFDPEELYKWVRSHAVKPARGRNDVTSN
jgi:excisionase family DNA binding protein